MEPTSKLPTPDLRKGIKAYFQDVIREMHKVVWPSRADTIRFTIMVILVCVIFIMYLWLFGLLVEFVFNFLIGA
ncbi:MAG TPA: preprotein translocase subunit SecE [Fimbriimonadales bacterium]|nr:preprotein translocase subunit SecE [Fimbriimonadales bacterium]